MRRDAPTYATATVRQTLLVATLVSAAPLAFVLALSDPALALGAGSTLAGLGLLAVGTHRLGRWLCERVTSEAGVRLPRTDVRVVVRRVP